MGLLSACATVAHLTAFMTTRLFFELFPQVFPVWACALLLMGCCATYVLV